ncbi:MAG: VWA domain-containing protein [Bacteroidaceae bacterium]|nr:VWA domain-containing protein [Bacteroidaceae bacterium]
MKKIYKYTLLLIAAFLFAPLAAIAQDSNPQDPTNTLTGLGFTKNVTPDPTRDNAYNITLTAFTTGSTVSEAVNASVAADIVLVLDVSGSMAWYTCGDQVTTLTTDQNYVCLDASGNERYAKLFKDSWRNRWYLRYEENHTFPTSNSDGSQWGNNYYTSIPSIPSGWTFYKAGPTRIDAMKTAVKSFVQTVYSKNPAEGDKHKIAIVKFASETATGTYNGTQTIYNLTDVTSGTQCDAVINALNAGGATRADLGLAQAYSILNAAGDDGHSKVTVFFTDGSPTSGSSFEAATARNAVHQAYLLKGLETELKINGQVIEDEEGNPIILESKVYSVGLLTTESSGSTNAGAPYLDLRRFMHYVSSNYYFDINGGTYDFRSNNTNSKKLVNVGTEQDPKYEYNGAQGGNEPFDDPSDPMRYYQLSNGSDLTSIFESIASSSSNAPTIPLSLKSTDIVALDVISHSFKLPEGANASAIQVMVAPFTGIDETGDYTDAQKSRLEHYQFGTPITYTAASNDPDFVKGTPQKDSDGKIIRNNGVIQYESTYAPVATIDPNDRQKISVTGYNYADNWCGFDQHTENGHTTNIPHGYELVIVIPIEVDAANPGGASVDTNEPTSGIYITNEDGTTTFAGFPQPVVTLPNIIIRKYGLLYEGEGASFLLEKLNDAGTAVDTSVAPFRIVVVATDNNPSTYDFVQVKLNEPGRYRVTETDWGWSYICTVGEIVPVGTATSAAGGMEEDDSFDPDNTLMETSTGTNAKGQPYIDRDVSGDTEQTITLPGGSNLSGAVYDFHNESKQHEHRNYSEAHKLNEFNTVFNPTSK